MSGFVFLIILVTVLALWLALIYNRLVAMRQQVQNAWHQIDVQLKRRHDLIPGIVAAVKAYLEHEQSTLERVSAARNQALSAKGVENQSTAETGLTGALSRLMAVVEAYPNLKGDEPIRDLMEDLRSTENRIGFARQQYNDSVMHYNTNIQVFPNNLIAGRFGFTPSTFFQMSPGDEVVPEVTK